MQNLTIQNNASNTLSPAQKTFQRLNQRISNLKRALEERRHELEAGSTFYFGNIIPKEKESSAALVELIKIKYRLYKNRPDLKTSDRKIRSRHKLKIQVADMKSLESISNLPDFEIEAVTDLPSGFLRIVTEIGSSLWDEKIALGQIASKTQALL